MFFRSHFGSTLGKGKKSTQEAQQDAECANLVTDSGGPGPAGERKGEGIKNLGQILLVFNTLRTPSVGGGLKTPLGGDHRRPTPLGSFWRDVEGHSR